MNRPPLESQTIRSGLKAMGAFALAGGLTLMPAIGLRAQDAEQPAWERIADKLSPNSLEESSPEELPTVILPGDEANGAMADEDVVEELEGGTDEGGDVDVPADVLQAAEAALGAPLEEELTGEESPEETEGDMLQGRMDAAAPGTVGLPQAGGRRARGNAPNINLGKESDDTGQVVNLFDDPEVRRMLGDNPRFIYGALRSPDPMIFPPVRNAAIYAELSMEAERLIKQGKLEEAQQCYKRILDLNDKRYALEMRNKIAQLNNRLGAARMILTDDQMVEVKLPAWVRANSRGILYDETDPMVLVGDYTLRLGDPVPSHPEVRVESISKHSVTYRVADRKSFNVAVKGFQE